MGKRRLAATRVTAAGLYRTVGIPVFKGRASPRSTAAPTIRRPLLLQTRFDLWQIGGSHAQRDVVDWIPTGAALRAGRRPHRPVAGA
jgi:hypothetical protein